MKAVAEVQVIPIGSGVSVRREVQRAHELLRDAGLHVELHAYGTNVEGELADVLAALQRIHEALHANGVPRIHTNVKLGTRTDKAQSLDDKINAIKG